MDYVSDTTISRIVNQNKLENENKLLKQRNKFLIFGIFLFMIVSIFNIWFFMFVGKKFGYEEAVRDFYKGSLKCDMVNEQVIWKEPVKF